MFVEIKDDGEFFEIRVMNDFFFYVVVLNYICIF